MMILSALASFACGVFQSDNQQASEEPKSLDLAVQPIEGEPFIRAYPPPEQPPVVQVVMDGPSGEMTVDGYSYVVDWNIPPNPQTKPAVEPIKWPDDVVAHSSPPRSIRLLTDSRPRFVVVMGYEGPEPPGEDDSNEPLPSIDYECVRSEIDKCMHITPDGFVELGQIPGQVLQLPYLVVFAEWDVPSSDNLKAYGNWLFNLAKD